MKKIPWFLWTALILASLIVIVFFIYYGSRPKMVNLREEIYPCITYYRRVHTQPRMLVAHIVTVDLSCKNI